MHGTYLAYGVQNRDTIDCPSRDRDIEALAWPKNALVNRFSKPLGELCTIMPLNVGMLANIHLRGARHFLSVEANLGAEC